LHFLSEDFLLHSDFARRLYHGFAANAPLLDFHSHLPADDISSDRRFHDLTEIWLEGDHYKWRAMRAHGVAESLCTGDASPYEKFLAWARTLPYTLRNPLYHWAHLELKRYFQVEEALDERTAKRVWERANSLLADDGFTAQAILRRFSVQVACTSNDPCESLDAHAAINRAELGFRVYPTFRPDNALRVGHPQSFAAWVQRLTEASNVDIGSFAAFVRALQRRHEYFHEHGARLSDHGLPYCYASPCSESQAEEIFTRARAGVAASPAEQEQFASLLMLFFARLDAARGWTKQLHLGALRGVNTQAVARCGADGGFDAVGDWPQAERLAAYLDLLERESALPKMVVYNLNPADNYVFATIAGAFTDRCPGKIQLGSAWWFLDQKDGIEAQLNALSRTGLLAHFVGMVTDSRSFMSFPRHEYFRRILCDVIGRDVENGELPEDEAWLGKVVRNICFENARDYLGLETPNLRPSKAQAAEHANR